MWVWSAISKLKISKNKIFILCNEIIHKNLAAVQKNSILKLVLTYPGIFSVKWPSIPMFYTCKKNLFICTFSTPNLSLISQCMPEKSGVSKLLWTVGHPVFVPRGASKEKAGRGWLPSPPPHISSGLWISLFVQASKYVVVVSTVWNTVLIPVTLSVAVMVLKGFDKKVIKIFNIRGARFDFSSLIHQPD